MDLPTATEPAMPMTNGVRSGCGSCRNFSVARQSSAAYRMRMLMSTVSGR